MLFHGRYIEAKQSPNSVKANIALCNQFHKFQHILRWCIQSKNRLEFLTPKTDFRTFWGHVWVICSLVQSVKAALPQCNGHERANIILIKMFDQLQYILEIVCWEKMKIWFLTSKINFWNFWGHFWVISSLIQSVKAALPQCKGLKKAKIILFNVLDKLQFILEWFVEIKWKFDFLTWKKWFSKFLRSFLTHFDIQSWKDAQTWLLRRSQKNLRP